MKNKLLFALLLSAIQIVTISQNAIFAQKIKSSEVPSDVVQTLDEQYSYVKVTGWMKEGNTYIANIKDGSTTGKVYLTSSGEWIRTLFMVPVGELPSSITDYVKENYPDFIIVLSCLEEKEDESTHYYLEVKEDVVGAKPSLLTFSTTGQNKLISRKDPEGFQDPTVKHPDKIEQAKAAAAEKQAAKEEAAKREAAEKAAADKAAKEAAKNSPKAPASKPATPPAAKPANATAKANANTAKPAQTAQKEAKPKKEKPEPVVKDEHGNIAIKANTVPDVVSKALAKKVLHPAELNWFLVDSVYIARCLNQGKKTAVYITPAGVWEKTLTIMPEESVSGLMAKHLNDFYPGWRFKSAVKEQRADKDDKMMVEFYEKANYKAKLVTTIFFDKAGKLIRTIDPDYELGGSKKESAEDDALNKYYEKMNMDLGNDDAASVPENVKAAFKLKYPKVNNVEWKEDGYMNYQAIFFTTRGKEVCVYNSYGELVETWVMGKNESLSATIQDYLKKEYKGYKLKEYYSVKRLADKLNAYKVIIVDKKTQDEQELWFNLSGKPIEY
ncbi:MAG: PepSY-like domain-containing protein [Bacteroidales bacterium]|nr:PepSY-like domain-containing protein [Bacteroidales bacterium]